MPVAAPHRPHLRTEAEELAARYPGLLAEAERVASIVAQGVHGRRRSGLGETFWQYRGYTPSDSATQIDWRRSARSDHLFVRENEWEAANTVWLWCDGSAGMDWASTPKIPTKKDRATVLLMALSSLLMRAGERCAVLGMSDKPHTGRFGIERIASKLLRSEGKPQDIQAPFNCHARLVLASDFLEPLDQWRDRLSQLSGRSASGLLIHLIDPAEESFPFKGRLKLLDPETPRPKIPFLLGRAETKRAEYLEKFAAHKQAISDMGRRLGWRVVVHHTDKPATQALSAIYAILSEDK
ncbi:MAG TPA: DUF58 domain-containing protein [Hellea balneolensis]|uniref:DUF58 domain-containing protein n=1 Tax=Hellea balneolensis TaxID=287478 RepID=A0A7C5M0N4_9PROT|nr:DUF58 domain-containing protein [Hellea balneolensis]